MSRFLSEQLRSMAPYTPGEQPKGAERIIKLNTNESPYPPSPAVLRVINSEQAAQLRLYSDPDATTLLRALADTFGVGTDMVYAGNGSDEVLAFSFMAFGASGVSYPDQTYGFYQVYAELFRLPRTVVPLREDFSIAVEDYAGKKGAVYIANPNAPTGIALPLSDIARLLSQDRDRLVVVDEAYVDFGGDSAVKLLGEYDNLLIIGTFSKSRSLAGARLGYAVGSPELIADMNRVKFSFHPYNVNRLTMAAGVAALSEPEYYRECSRKIQATRERISAQLRALGFTTTESRANFIFAGCPERLGGGEYYEKLKQRGILIRHWSIPRIENYVRISVGTPEQMDALITATKELLK